MGKKNRGSRKAAHLARAGGPIRCPVLPPNVRYEHWRPITLTWKTDLVPAKKIYFAIGDLVKELGNQLGVKTDYVFRLRHVRIWELKGVAFEFVAFAQIDLVGPAYATHKLYRVEAYPGRTTYARAGYQWPRTENSIPTNGTEENLLFSVDTDADAQVMIHLHIEFMFASAKPYLSERPAALYPGYKDYPSPLLEPTTAGEED